jgi:hypothetical protein
MKWTCEEREWQGRHARDSRLRTIGVGAFSRAAGLKWNPEELTNDLPELRPVCVDDDAIDRSIKMHRSFFQHSLAHSGL